MEGAVFMSYKEEMSFHSSIFDTYLIQLRVMWVLGLMILLLSFSSLPDLGTTEIPSQPQWETPAAEELCKSLGSC